MHPKAVIRNCHSQLLELDATFPIAPDQGDPDPEAVGSLDLGDRVIHEIKIVPEQYFMRERTSQELKEFYPVSCAILDYANGVVYTFSSAVEHSRLMDAYGILPGTKQHQVEEGLICGFVTASGHFFNRWTMKYFVQKHHPGFFKETKADYFFNSSMINWKVVKEHILRRAVAK